MNVVSGSPAERLARALANAALPEQLRRALASAPPDPLPGQLWRARRDETSMLVLLAHVEPTTVYAIPITMDDAYGTEESVVLERDASPLGVSLTVWPELARTLPMRVLERYAGNLELAGADTNPIGAVRAVGRPGRRVISPADPALEYWGRIGDEVAFLAGASDPSGSGELPEILANAGLPTAELARVLDVSSTEVLRLRRGERLIGSAEAARLAPVLGLAPDDLMAANPAAPDSLLAVASRPRRRAQVLALARVKNISEDSAFTRVLFETYALAARASGDRDSTEAWEARLDRYFQMVIDA